ncbi:kinesin-like protein CG14535 [Anabrus simplex]|uniref:kinesin-like protein CG14535 n=1 Tax=Anabrus simplex TaxID=316456 RepID=UPI0035A3D089
MTTDDVDVGTFKQQASAASSSGTPGKKILAPRCLRKCGYELISPLHESKPSTSKLLEVRMDAFEGKVLRKIFGPTCNTESGRAAQKLNLSTSPQHKHRTEDVDASFTEFTAAIHQSPPPVPPALLRRIGVREVTGIGKVKVMLRVCSSAASGTSNCNGTTTSTSSSSSFFSIDARKKQVTLFDPAACGGSSAPEDRRVGVAAPKMFAFDAIFSQDDSQTEICSSALTDVIHAVINGTDGCLFCFGHARLGKTYTMVGSPESAHTLGVIPCAISWLFRGINEQKQKTGARFSVRVSAVEVLGSSHHLKDLLAAHATDSEQSPGVYLRDDPLFGTQLQNQSELRVPTAEKAAFYLDAALNSREGGEKDSHFLYTLHVYQYSVADRGGVAGGRSRLHLIDLASCETARSSGGLPLSGLGNVLLAIFNGQKHLPYREYRITHLLKECLSSLTCHAAMIVHVSPYAQHYMDTLATVQLASRIHRMRRRKIKFVGGTPGCGRSSSDEVAHLQSEENGQSTGSSDVDPSSSEQSADTVIYVGPSDDATDGEHPPVYIPSLNCAVGNGLRGPSTSPQHFSNGNSSPSHRNTARHSTQPSSVVKPILSNNNNSCKSSPVRNCKNSSNIPILISLANQQSLSQSNKVLTSDTISGSDEQWIDGPRISKSKIAEARHLLKDGSKKRETWIDGPQVVKLPGGGHSNGSYGFMDSHKKSMIRKWVENQTVEIQNHLPVESPSTSLSPTINSCQESIVLASEERLTSRYPDDVQESLKDNGVTRDLKISESAMIILGKKLADRTEEAKENSIFVDVDQVNNRAKRSVHQGSINENSVEGSGKSKEGTGCKKIHSEEGMKVRMLTSSPSELLRPHSKDLDISLVDLDTHLEILDRNPEDGCGVADDEEIEIIEVEEPTEPVPMQDSCLQVTEEDIALCMGKVENPLPEVDQQSSEEHPLRVLSQENLTVVSTFADSLSVISDMEKTLHQHRFAVPLLLDRRLHCHRPFSAYTFPDAYKDHHSDLCLSTDNFKRKTSAEVGHSKLTESQKRLDQLAQLHKIYKNKLTYASIQNTNNQIQPLQCHTPSRYHSLSLTNMFDDSGGSDSTKPDIHYIENSSIYSEPMYDNHLQTESEHKICDNCKLDLNQTSATNLHAPHILSNGRNQFLGCSNFGSGFIYNHDSSWFSCKTSSGKCNISSLRHPDGASNPNLKEEVGRVPGNGASVLDPEEETREPGEVLSTVMEKACTNECDDEKPQVLPSALSMSSSSRLHRRLFGKACARLGLSARLKPSTRTAPEEYDSGHDSASPQPVKVRSKTLPECGSLGYESVVLDSESSSFSSSQDSGLHDPGGVSKGK